MMHWYRGEVSGNNIYSTRGFNTQYIYIKLSTLKHLRLGRKEENMLDIMIQNVLSLGLNIMINIVVHSFNTKGIIFSINLILMWWGALLKVMGSY